MPEFTPEQREYLQLEWHGRHFDPPKRPGPKEHVPNEELEHIRAALDQLGALDERLFPPAPPDASPAASSAPKLVFSSEATASTPACGPARIDATFRLLERTVASGSDAVITEKGPGIDGRTQHVSLTGSAFRVSESVTVADNTTWRFDLETVAGKPVGYPVYATYVVQGCARG